MAGVEIKTVGIPTCGKYIEMMSIDLVKALTFPIVLAVLLMALLLRGANRWCVLAAFLAGGLGAFSLNNSILRNLPSVYRDGQIHAATAFQAWWSGFVEASIPEEFAKGIWILVFLVGWRRYAAPHGALIGGMVGLGFALRENLAYAQVIPEWRVMGAVSHGEWGIIMGSLFQRALGDARWRFRGMVWGFVAPIVLHGLVDASVFLVEAYESQTGLSSASPPSEVPFSPVLLAEMACTFVVELVSLVWAIRLIRWARSLRRTADPSEVTQGAME